MGRISNYEVDTDVSSDDRVLGIDSKNGNKTKTFRLGDIIDFFTNGITAYVENVELQGNNLVFTSTGNAFEGVIDLSGLNTDTPDFIENVELQGTNLVFTGLNGAFNGSVNLSSINTDTNTHITNVELVGDDIVFTGGVGAFNGSINLSQFRYIPTGLSDVSYNESTKTLFFSSFLGAAFNKTINLSSSLENEFHYKSNSTDAEAIINFTAFPFVDGIVSTKELISSITNIYTRITAKGQATILSNITTNTVLGYLYKLPNYDFGSTSFDVIGTLSVVSGVTKNITSTFNLTVDPFTQEIKILNGTKIDGSSVTGVSSIDAGTVALIDIDFINLEIQQA